MKNLNYMLQMKTAIDNYYNFDTEFFNSVKIGRMYEEYCIQIGNLYSESNRFIRNNIVDVKNIDIKDLWTHECIDVKLVRRIDESIFLRCYNIYESGDEKPKDIMIDKNTNDEVTNYFWIGNTNNIYIISAPKLRKILYETDLKTKWYDKPAKSKEIGYKYYWLGIDNAIINDIITATYKIDYDDNNIYITYNGTELITKKIKLM